MPGATDEQRRRLARWSDNEVRGGKDRHRNRGCQTGNTGAVQSDQGSRLRRRGAGPPYGSSETRYGLNLATVGPEVRHWPSRSLSRAHLSLKPAMNRPINLNIAPLRLSPGAHPALPPIKKRFPFSYAFRLALLSALCLANPFHPGQISPVLFLFSAWLRHPVQPPLLTMPVQHFPVLEAPVADAPMGWTGLG